MNRLKSSVAVFLIVLTVMCVLPSSAERTYEEAMNGYAAVIGYLNRLADNGVNIGEDNTVFADNLFVQCSGATFLIVENNKVMSVMTDIDTGTTYEKMVQDMRAYSLIRTFFSDPAMDGFDELLETWTAKTFIEIMRAALKATKDNPAGIGGKYPYSVYISEKDDEKTLFIVYTGP